MRPCATGDNPYSPSPAVPLPVDREGSIKFLAGIIKQGVPPAPHLSGMKRRTANIDIRVEPQLVESIDAWRARQRVAPSRSAAIVYMLEHFLENDPAESIAVWKRFLSRA